MKKKKYPPVGCCPSRPKSLNERVNELVNRSPFGLGRYGVADDIDEKPPRDVETETDRTAAAELRKPLIAETDITVTAASGGKVDTLDPETHISGRTRNRKRRRK
jgi:hypothetical protein